MQEFDFLTPGIFSELRTILVETQENYLAGYMVDNNRPAARDLSND